MRVLVTGASGFVGRELVHRLLSRGSLRGQLIDTLLVLDKDLCELPDDSRLRRHGGSVTDSALLRRILADGIDVVFHLVSIASGAAEENYEVGYQVNLLASLELLHQLRNKACPPVMVYASSVAVYGRNFTERMNEQAPLYPELSYATHKVVIEEVLTDLGRRAEVDGRALRFPDIVARLRGPNGLHSAFMSNLLRAVADEQPYCCPVSPDATCWWVSARSCVNNLIRAAELSAEVVAAQRVWQLPVLRLSVAEIVDALAARFGNSRRQLISYAPEPALEALFGSHPPLRTPLARAAGFRHDGTAAALIRNALNPTVFRGAPTHAQAHTPPGRPVCDPGQQSLHRSATIAAED